MDLPGVPIADTVMSICTMKGKYKFMTEMQVFLRYTQLQRIKQMFELVSTTNKRIF